MQRPDGRPTVLLIMQDDDLRSAVQRFLSRSGYDALAPDTAEHALEIVGTGVADVLLSSMRVPGATPQEFVAQAHRMAPETPIILLSAVDESQTAVECRSLGACDSLLAPVHFEELELVLAEALARKRASAAHRALQADMANHNTQVEALQSLSLKLIHALVAHCGSDEERKRHHLLVDVASHLADAGELDQVDGDTIILAAEIAHLRGGQDDQLKRILSNAALETLPGGNRALELLDRAAGAFNKDGAAIPLPARVFRVAQVMARGGSDEPDLEAARELSGSELDPEIVALAESLVS